MKTIHRAFGIHVQSVLLTCLATVMLAGCMEKRQVACLVSEDEKGGSVPVVLWGDLAGSAKIHDDKPWWEKFIPTPVKGISGCSTIPSGGVSAQNWLLLNPSSPYPYTVLGPAPAGYVCNTSTSKCASPGSICSNVGGTKYCKNAVFQTSTPGNASCTCACKP